MFKPAGSKFRHAAAVSVGSLEKKVGNQWDKIYQLWRIPTIIQEQEASVADEFELSKKSSNTNKNWI